LAISSPFMPREVWLDFSQPLGKKNYFHFHIL
jgi:hypothetical protein